MQDAILTWPEFPSMIDKISFDLLARIYLFALLNCGRDLNRSVAFSHYTVISTASPEEKLSEN
jgi:hypothetical protein